MPLTVHHLQTSQSERLPWLCEELQIPYTLVLHQRAPFFSPQSIKDLNPLGSAPVIQDGSLTLAESAACIEYISHNYTDYLYWFHFSNGTFQPQISTMLQISQLDKQMTSPGGVRGKERLAKMLGLLDERLTENTWLAGDEFTAADIMIIFSLTTMRSFYPYSLEGYQGILGYLERLVGREGFQRARAKADPGLELMIGGEPPVSYGERLKAAGKI
ncbi:glutathione S-transferase [Hyaloscypha variabilis]